MVTSLISNARPVCILEKGVGMFHRPILDHRFGSSSFLSFVSPPSPLLLFFHPLAPPLPIQDCMSATPLG